MKLVSSPDGIAQTVAGYYVLMRQKRYAMT
jgi:hypothetical protein